MARGREAAIGAEFIRRMPKSDLHVHLDGSLRLPTLLELAREQKVKLPARDEQGLRELVFKDTYESLADYLRGFACTCAVLRTPEALERVACELAEDNIAEGVRYVEVRFAPQLVAHEGLPILDALGAVARGLGRAKRAHNAAPAVARGDDLPFEFGIIACAMRCFDESMGSHFAKFFHVLSHAPAAEVASIASLEMARAAVAARDERGLPVVGFDLAGEEAGYPAGQHRGAYQYAHKHFLKKTVHAGEAYGPESIFQAITVCHANRIGHGTFLFEPAMLNGSALRCADSFVSRLADYIASQRITVEVCLTSNMQTTPDLGELSRHPLRKMLAHGLSVCLCTDNRLVSNTTVTRELELAVAHLGVSRAQLRNLTLAGFKGSFYPGCYREKRAYVRKAIDLYERLERELAPRA